MVVIRDAPIRLDPKSAVTGGFFGLYVPDHPDATARVGRGPRRRAFESAGSRARRPRVTARRAASDNATLFSAAPLLETLDLDVDTLREYFGSQWRHEEVDERGERLSFFHGADRHVVLRAKELRVLRPHGHLLRTGRHTTPDETALTSTAWMSGVFHSMVTEGHVSINRFLSTVHTYLGLFRSHGQRVFVEIGASWQLLNIPSAFEMSPDACRWIYRHAGGVIQVRAEAHSEPHELTLSVEVLSGPPARFLISHHVALNDDDGSAPGAAVWRRDGDKIVLVPAPNTELSRRFPAGSFAIAPLPGTTFQQVGGDELLFLDQRSRQQPFVCIVTAPAASVGLSIRGHLVPNEAQTPLLADAGIGLIPKLGMTVTSYQPPGRAPGESRRHRAVVYAERPGALPVAARPGAILRRRLGHARRLPGAGGAATRAGSPRGHTRSVVACHEATEP